MLLFSVFAGCMCWTSGVCAWVRHSSGKCSIYPSGQHIPQKTNATQQKWKTIECILKQKLNKHLSKCRTLAWRPPGKEQNISKGTASNE